MPINYSLPVLVVNDVASMTQIIRSLLQKIGFTDVDDAPNGAEALQKIQRGKYGLVISDWKMQPMDGQELLEAVRATPDIADTPFIMITAHTEPGNQIAATLSGADGYIAVPFSLKAFKKSILEILDR
jgi:two-component system, chemotaxis family, chemotaxis protein CheY